jgi:hypothetical protein
VSQKFAFTMAEYAKALSKLPVHYLCRDAKKVNRIIFRSCIYVCDGEHTPLCYHGGQWHEFIMNTDYGIAFSPEDLL